MLLKALRAACADVAGPAAEPPAGVSAETPSAAAQVPGDPADPARCHVEDGPAISVSTAQMLACTAAVSWMRHGDGGAVLALGRPGAAPAPPSAAPPGGGEGFGFYRPDGTPLPSSPPLPEPDGDVDAAHDADIAPDTIIPPWYGERLDLDYAIYVCFANARTEEEKQDDRNQDSDSATRSRVTVYEPEDWPERIRQYEVRTIRRFAWPRYRSELRCRSPL